MTGVAAPTDVAYRVNLKAWDEKKAWISSEYLLGFFSKELTTDVYDALAKFGPDDPLPPQEWVAKTEQFVPPSFKTPKFQVGCDSLDEDQPLTVSVVRDFFKYAPSAIFKQEDWRETVYKTIIVEILHFYPDGYWRVRAKCQIDSWALLDEWIGEDIIFNDSILHKDNKASAEEQSSNPSRNITTITKRQPISTTTDCSNSGSGSSNTLTGPPHNHRRFEFKFSLSEGLGSATMSSSYIRGFFTKTLSTLINPDLTRFGYNYRPAKDKFSVETPSQSLIGFPAFYVHLAAKDEKELFTLDLVREFYEQVPELMVKAEGWEEGKYRSIDVSVFERGGDGGEVESAWGFVHALTDAIVWRDEVVQMKWYGLPSAISR